MAFQFPWTNLHELNLDWFLSKFKQFTDNYLGTTATAESVPNGTPPSVTVTGGELDDDTDIVDPFTFNFKIPAGAQGAQGIPGQDGFSPIATVTKSGTVATITITDVNGTTTATISDGEVTQDQLDTKAPAIFPTVSGSIANFSDGADNLPMSELMVDIIPAQSGSGDPAPDNIRPFSGWTGCNVNRAGKNLLSVQPTLQTNQPQLIADLGRNTTGQTFTITFDFDNVNYQYASSALIDLKEEDGTHHYLTPGNFSNGQTTLANATKPASGRYSYRGNYKFRYVYSYFMSVNYGKWSGAINNAQLEIGAISTAYEPYQSDIITVDWTSDAGTVYGGTLDVRTGLLTVTHKLVQLLATASWTITNNAGYASLSSLGVTPPMKNPPIGTPSRTLTRTNWCKTNALIPTSTGWSATASSNIPQFVVSYDDYLMLNIGVPHPTSAQINQFITDVGLQLYYPLATAQTYQLTPQQLFNTLYGGNNVWCNVGDSTVKYTADTMLYIQNLTQPTEDDMIANTAIANGKFFMIGNNLYRATTAIASGSQIIPGTNATALSLADALNLL